MRRSPGRLAPGPNHGPDGDEREEDEDGNSEPRADRRCDHDQREVADAEQDEPERVGLVAEGIPHVGLLRYRR
jgi:hypothetical protein